MIVEMDPPEPPLTVTAQNRSSVTVDVDRLAALAGAALKAESVHGPAHLDLVFVDLEEMAELNAAHMGYEGPTDVLSFPIDVDTLTDADPRSDADTITDTDALTPAGPPRLVGDLVICPSYAQHSVAVEDPTRDWDVDDELALLVVHGVLHLVGYDHAEIDERVVMQRRERELLADLCALRYDPGPETQ